MKRHEGLSLIDILVSLLLISIVAVGSGAVISSLGLLGRTQFSTSRYERPSRLRTLAMEYIQAEMEYLRNRPYAALRDPLCPSPTLMLDRPGPGSGPGGRVPVPNGYLPGEPELPNSFYAADIVIEDEPIVGTAPNNCLPRRISVRVYLTEADVLTSVEKPDGEIFARGVTVRAQQ